jgi:hypothetical protein
MRIANSVHYMSFVLNFSVIVSLLTTVGGILFFTVGEPFGAISDVFSIVLMISLIVIALLFYFILRSQSPALSGIATAIGILGMLVFAIAQTLLVVAVLSYEQVSIMTTFAGGAIGVWFIVEAYVTLRGKLLPPWLCWIGIVVGAGYLLSVVGFLSGEFESPLYMLGFVATYFGYPIWAFWLGRAYSRNRQPLVPQHMG